MRKFKMKNVPKRRYVRRQPVSTPVSFSRTLLAGLMPTLLIGIALLATAIINLRLVDSSIYLLFYKNVIDSLLHLLTSIQLHKITFTFTLPHVDAQPVLILLEQLVALLVFLFSSAIHGIIFVASFMVKGLLLTIHILSESAILIAHFIVQAVSLLGNLLWDVLQTLFAIITLVINGLSAIINFIVNAIINALKAIWRVMEIPFIILDNYYRQTEPYMRILNKHLGAAASEMSSSFAQVITGSAELMKSPHIR